MYIQFWVWNDLAGRLGDVSTSSKRRFDFEKKKSKNTKNAAKIVKKIIFH